MIQTLPLGLSELECKILLSVRRLVPKDQRQDWSRAWHAELWHMRERSCERHAQPLAEMADLYIGLTRDALWLRTDEWRRSFYGTPILCIARLLGCNAALLLIVLLLQKVPQADRSLRDEFIRSVWIWPCVLVVGLAIAPYRQNLKRLRGRHSRWMKRQLFLAAKITNAFVSAFLLSVVVCQPVGSQLPITADLLQLLCFVLLTLLSLRWATRDQQQRCEQCLQLLGTPARIGRPSHNLLEWNGSEMACKRGHGCLSIPELETSWCSASQWNDLKVG
jgi:hypothetical protein